MADDNSLASITTWKKQTKAVSEAELNRSLTLLGFGAWSSLEPSSKIYIICSKSIHNLINIKI